MARVLLEQGAGDSALDALRRATELTPGSVTRLVKHGLLASYYGHEREASQILERAARIGQDARVFDLQALVLATPGLGQPGGDSAGE